MPRQLWGLRPAGSTGPHEENIHPPVRGRKFSILLSVNLRICKISFFFFSFSFLKRKTTGKPLFALVRRI